jgi:hypothetical protein
LTFSAIVPDLHHYNGRGGRVFPLWSDPAATKPNIPAKLLEFLAKKYKAAVTAEDIMAYLAAVASNPSFPTRFESDLSQPGLRIPVTASGKLFAEAVELGRTVIWLHTFGERFVDPKNGRPAGPPRLPKDRAPRIPKEGALPAEPGNMPNEIGYDAPKRRLLVGSGFIDNVHPGIWAYEVSGKHVLSQWFSYRRADRDRPIMGDRRPPSKLGEIQPDYWPAEYTTELLNVVNILGLLVELATAQADLLDRICSGKTIPATEFPTTKAVAPIADPKKRRKTIKPGRGQVEFLE